MPESPLFVRVMYSLAARRAHKYATNQSLSDIFAGRITKWTVCVDWRQLRYLCNTMLRSLPESGQKWLTPPDQLSLAAKDVHIWRASLEQPQHTVETLRQLLSPDELTRADRFHFEKDRRHFTVARGLLRKLLGRYLGMTPAAVGFTYAEHGKPMVTVDLADDSRELKFNLAHSGGLALYAFTRAGEIGVDLEHIRSQFTGDDIARRFFSAAEVACLNQLPAPLRQEAFFNCWTRKEAFIKGKGMGLSLGLDQFDVTLEPNEPAALLCTRWDHDEAARWSLKEIEVGQGFVGAIAVEAHDWEPSYWQLDIDT
jgi:4'-phosphopantetheinyl transferase